jgi:hypothetical protein
MELKKWYKSMIESGAVTPPEETWESIQNELDIDLVWNRLENKLGERKKKSRTAIFSIAALLLLLFAIGSLMYVFIFTQEQLISGDQIASQESGKINQEIPVREDLIQPVTPFASLQVNQETAIEVENGTLLTISDEILTLENQLSMGRTEKMENIDPISAQLSGTDVTNQLAQLQFNESEKMTDEVSGKSQMSFYTGFSGHLANTWMMNNKTIEGLRKDEFTTTNATIGKNLGFLVGTNINNRLGLQAEFYFISQSNQNYHEYQYGKYVSNQIGLDYYTMTLLAKYQPKFLESPHRMMGGGYIGFMKSASQDINGVNYNIADQYSGRDYGILLGYEYSLPVKERLYLSTGVMSKLGLRNVFSGNEYIPSYLNRTQNISFNFFLSLNYRIF